MDLQTWNYKNTQFLSCPHGRIVGITVTIMEKMFYNGSHGACITKWQPDPVPRILTNASTTVG